MTPVKKIIEESAKLRKLLRETEQDPIFGLIVRGATSDDDEMVTIVGFCESCGGDLYEIGTSLCGLCAGEEPANVE